MLRISYFYKDCVNGWNSSLGNAERSPTELSTNAKDNNPFFPSAFFLFPSFLPPSSLPSLLSSFFPPSLLPSFLPSRFQNYHDIAINPVGPNKPSSVNCNSLVQYSLHSLACATVWWCGKAHRLSSPWGGYVSKSHRQQPLRPSSVSQQTRKGP